MRRAVGTVLATLLVLALVALCFAIAFVIGAPHPLGVRAFDQCIQSNRELRTT